MFGFYKDFKESGKLDSLLATLGQFLMMFLQTLGIVVAMIVGACAICGIIVAMIIGLSWVISNAGPIIGAIIGVIFFTFLATVWGWFSGYRP